MLQLWSWPKRTTVAESIFGPRWLRVRSGFDDGGEEQKTAERESELVELDVIDKDAARTGCRWVLEGEAAHPRVGIGTPNSRDDRGEGGDDFYIAQRGKCA